MKLIDDDELESLLKDRYILCKLEETGVDNWEGYDIALRDCEVLDDEKYWKDKLSNYSDYEGL